MANNTAVLEQWRQTLALLFTLTILVINGFLINIKLNRVLSAVLPHLLWSLFKGRWSKRTRYETQRHLVNGHPFGCRLREG
ncbi:hypothetical protein K439DRAFT_415270 [Ramaria rubella]|nr:hypothetical protein K439DRAFT_415270 [Ramaria rubella]